MTPEIFVAGVRSEIIDRNLALYTQLFETVPVDGEHDEHWSRALTMYHSLTEEHRRTFFDVLRRTMFETVCSVLATMDGVTAIAGQQGTISLLGSEGTHPISGRLVELLLELESDAP